MKEIKLGFIGLGYIGKIHAIACFAMPLVFQNLPFKVRLGPVYKRNFQDVPDFFEKNAVSVEELLNVEGLTAVDICTPNYLHFEEAMKVIEKGYDIYLEKPIGLNAQEAFKIKRAAEDKRIINQTALMYRFMPAVAQARDMIKNGEIGELLNFKAMMLHSGYLDPKRPISWKLKKATCGGGSIVDMGIHLIDAVRFMLGEITSLEVKSKTFFKERPSSYDSDTMEKVDVDDWTGVNVELESGAWGLIETSRISAEAEEETRFQIYGTEGSIMISTKHPDYAILYNKKENRTYSGTYKDEGAFTKYVRSIYPGEKFSMGYMVNMHMASLINFFTNVTERRVVYSETPTFEEAYKDQLILDRIVGN